jgi:hypothetical protein
MINELNVKLLQTIDTLNTSNLLTGIYDNGSFYLTSPNKLLIVNNTDQKNVTVYSAELNGSCPFIEKYKTTIHLSCFIDKQNYIAEIFVNGTTIFINRFYADE